jgi:hypothetical protein
MEQLMLDLQLLSNLKHYELEPFITNKIQGTIIRLEALFRHPVSAEECNHFLSQLGTYCLVAGDWSAKNTAWESHLTTVKGRNFLQGIQQNNLNYLDH